MRLRQARGPLSAAVLEALHRPSGDTLPALDVSPDSSEILLDEDSQLALWVCYELSYRGVEEIDADREWTPHSSACDGHWKAA
jgi:hypothetical protein